MNTENTIQNAGPFSIYIPRVSAGYNVPLLEHIFNRDIGAVERVDVIPFGINKWADRANPNTRYNKVFVHFKFLYNYELSKQIYQALSQEGGSYRWHTQPREYFILLKNRDPVPSTLLNIHQVVDNCRLTEQEISKKAESQQQEITDLKKRVFELEGKNERMLEEFMQVLGALNNSGISNKTPFGAYNFLKFGEYCNHRYLIHPDDDGSNEFLCTHAQQWKYGKYAEPEDQDQVPRGVKMELDELSLSSNSSSMPSLIEDWDDEIPRGTKMTLQELYSSSDDEEEEKRKEKFQNKMEQNNAISSSASSESSRSFSTIPVIERIRNSAELCGNN